MTAKERLAFLIVSLKLKQVKFAQSINVSQPTVSDWLNKDNVNPGIDALTSISRVHNVNLNWLLTGNGTMFNAVIPAEVGIPTLSKPSHFLQLPVIESIAAGTPLEIPDHYEPLTSVWYNPGYKAVPDDFICFRVDGDSMSPEIRHNDYVIISRLYDFEALDDKIVAVQLEGANTLKTLHVDSTHQQSLFYPVNRRHKPIICDSEAPGNPVILGILVMLYRFYI